jgi:hypothetical protein
LRDWLEKRRLLRELVRLDREKELLQEELRIKLAAQAYTERLRRSRRRGKRNKRKAGG